MKSLAAAGRFQDEATAYLLGRADDADEQVCGMAIFSLGEVAPSMPGLIAQLEQQLRETTRPLPRYAAAYVLGRLLKGDAPPLSMKILFAAIDEFGTLSVQVIPRGLRPGSHPTASPPSAPPTD